MATQDKASLMLQVEGTLKTRMFANLMDEAMEEINAHLDGYDVTRISFGSEGSDDMLKAFIEAKKTEGRSEATLTRYQYTIERFMQFVKVKTRDVTTYHVRSYISHEQDRGIAESTIAGVKLILDTYFGWLVSERMIAINPLNNIGNIKVPKREKEIITDCNMEKLKRSCCNYRDAAMIEVFRSTGCRVGEVVKMNRDDINYETKEITVIGKGDKERIVFIDDVASMAVKEYLLTRSDKEPALFINKHGQRLKPGGVRMVLNRIAEVAGVEHIHPHRFRTTLITNLLDNGMPIQEVKVLAGHDQIETTMQYYVASKDKIKMSYRMYNR